MRKKLILLFFFLLFKAPSYAQVADTTIRYYKTMPFEDDERQVNNFEAADFYQIIYPPDSSDLHLYNVKEFYKNGVCRFIGKALINKINDARAILLEGTGITFYPNGRRKNVTTYKSGHQEGPSISYYPDGKIYCSINYVKRAPIFYDCYDNSGNMIAHGGNGHWITYSRDMSNILLVGTVKDGLMQGDWTGSPMIIMQLNIPIATKRG